MPLNAGKIRILTVDDHAAMREGIAAMVNAQPDMTIAGEASNGEEAIQKFRSIQPDVSLLDWNLPIVCGEEVLEKVIAEFPEARFIVITALSGDEIIERALHLGAKSYLPKETLRRELLQAIRLVHQGQKYVPEKIAGKLKNRN